jgi:hypothetical protein
MICSSYLVELDGSPTMPICFGQLAFVVTFLGTFDMPVYAHW